jgi:hypothetical protein
MGWNGNEASMEDRKGAPRVFVGKPDRRKSLEYLSVEKQYCTGCYIDIMGGCRLDLSQDGNMWRDFVNAVTNHCVLCNTGNFLTVLGTFIFS